jgi:hypothetical protein
VSRIFGIFDHPFDQVSPFGRVDRTRAQASAARPRLQELKAALTRVEREIANFTRAVATGDFSSLEGALTAAEARRATLLAEMVEVEKVRAPGALQLTPAALDRYLQALVQELGSGVQGTVRDALERTVGKITVERDGTMTIETKPDGLLGIEGRFAPLGCRGSGPQSILTVRPELFVSFAVEWVP